MYFLRFLIILYVVCIIPRIFLVLLLLFGVSIAVIILKRFQVKSLTLNEEEMYIGANDEPRVALNNEMSMRHSASQGASALMQSLSNMASSTNNYPMNRSSYEQLLNYWTRQMPIHAWNHLPSTG